MNVKINPLDNLPSEKYFLVSWDQNYATGIPFIDNQHRELVELTNQLFSACAAGQDAAGPVFKDAMSRMVDYVRFHFSTELKLLKKIKYPDYQTHKKQHDILIKDILGAAKDFNDGKKFVPNHFARTLKEWIFGHIAVFDKNYSFYVSDQKKKGLLTEAELEI